MVSEKPNTVYIVDDDPGMRNSLTQLLSDAGFVVHEFSSAEEFLDSNRIETPACLLLDICMPNMSGVELQNQLISDDVSIPIIFLTAHGDVCTAVSTLKNGAVDYIQKPIPPKQLIKQLRATIELDATDSQHRIDINSINVRLQKLTARENEVLALIVDGESNKMIASYCNISENTVANHRANILRKMRAANTADLVRMSVTCRQPRMAQSCA